jgi:ribonuclease E
MQTDTEDRWYVEVGGAPKMMTLDELVEAFEAETINSKTLVCEVGGSEWKPLSDVADLGDDDEAPASQAAPAIAASVAPGAPGYVTPATLPPAPRSVAPVPVGGSSAFPPAVARATLSAWPPAVNASRPPLSGSMAPSAPSNSVVPPSTMPVVQDLSLPFDDDFKPRKSKAPYIAAAAVMLLVGGALGAAKFGGGGEVQAAVPVPAAAPAAVALPTAPSVAETTAPAATTPPAAAPAPSSDSASSEKSEKSAGLSDDVKSKLKDADKTRADKKKAAKSSRGRAPAKSKGSSGGVFRNGGNANDPLNSKL